MAGKAKEYTKLPGRGIKRGSLVYIVGIRARLWKGKDHILSILNFGYFEEYRRFYYKDIQAFTIRKTAKSMIWNAILTVLALLFAVLAIISEEYLSPFIWAVAAIFIVLLIVNILRGQSCITEIHTAVGSEELPSLGRLKKAEKVISMLEPLIEEAQGKLSPEEIQPLYEELAREKKGATPSRAREQLSAYTGKFHTILFIALLVDALLTGIIFFHNGVFITTVSTLLFFAVSALVIVALIKQHNSRIGKEVRFVTWSAMAYMVLEYILGYVFLIFVVAMEHPEAMNDQWEIIKIASSLSPYDNPYYMAMLVTSTSLSLLLGISGLALHRPSAGNEMAFSEPPPLQFEDAG